MKTNIIFHAIIFGLIIFAASESMAQKSTSIDEIIAEIEANNLSLKVIKSENEAELAALKSGNVVGPTSIEYSPFFRRGATGLASSELIVKQEFDFPTQYSARSKNSEITGTALNESMKVRLREIRVEALQACIDYVAANQRLELLADRLMLTDTILSLYEKKYSARAATALEINRIKLSRQDVAQEIARTELESQETESKLIALNGNKPLMLKGLNYKYDINNIPLPLSAKEYADNSAGVISAAAGIKAAECDLKIANNSWLPTIGLGYRRNTDGPEASNGFVIGMDFPIFSIGKNKKAAQARKAAAEMTLIEANQAAESEATSTLLQLQMLRKSIESYDVNLIKETISLYSESLRLGQITLTDFCQEADALFERMMTLNRLENDYRRLAATLMP